MKRAVKSALRLFLWDQALEIAKDDINLLETVIKSREKVMEDQKKTETNKKFLLKKVTLPHFYIGFYSNCW